MDRPLVEEKLESLRRCVERVSDKTPADVRTLQSDPDLQDIVAVNLTRAVQLSVDIAAHLIAGLNSPAPDTMGETFDILARHDLIPASLAERLKQAVGFRNVAVHQYKDIDWAIVHGIARNRLRDFEEFARAVVDALGR
ncbi:MAG TPA: DUF86 domain-containing protein [Gammaproteobacteria bacterium]|nr:DUF86 domain-containing protein [Gammaproteobacteria bacterium]